MSDFQTESRVISRMREALEKTAVVLKEEKVESLKRTQKAALLKLAEIMLRLEEEGRTRSIELHLQCNSGIPTALVEVPRLDPIRHTL